MRLLVAGRQRWNRVHFESYLSNQSGEWNFASSPEELEQRLSEPAGYNFIFFLHWSQIIPPEITDRNECVCFHMTNVPFGRGGSPLQNLISRGYRETTLSAIRMSSKIDAGPVYLKRPMSLEGSSAAEVYCRASKLSCEIALEIAQRDLKPEPQIGSPTFFPRRKPHESLLPSEKSSILEIHDHIRMLDAEGYPPAFIEIGNFKLEFSRSGFYSDHIKADVKITERKTERQ